MRRARRSARVPSSTASSWRSASIASCERPLSAIASSRLSGNASSTAIARSPAAAASSPAPAPPQHARQPAQVVADAQRVAGRLVEREQRAARLERALRCARRGRPRPRRPRAPRAVGRPPARPRAPPPSARAPGGGRPPRPPRGPPPGRGGGSPSASPARRAWWARRAGSASPRRLERAQHRAGRAPAGAAGEMPVLDRAAREVVAERERRRRAACSSPAAMHSSIAAGVAPTVAAEQPQLGRARDHRGELDDRARRRRRARRRAGATASRTLAGTPPPAGAASTSVTKNGLPPETACRSDASRPARSASSATAASDSGRGLDAPHALARQRAEDAPHLGALASARCGRSGSRQPGERARRRPSSATRSSVASSAQCRSSTTSDRRRARELVERGGEHVLARAAVDRRRERAAGLRARRRAAGPSGAA